MFTVILKITTKKTLKNIQRKRNEKGIKQDTTIKKKAGGLPWWRSG